MKKFRNTEVVIPHIHYVKEDGVYRLWASWNSPDLFNTVAITDIEPRILQHMKEYDKIFIEGYPDAPDGRTVCPLCRVGDIPRGWLEVEGG